MNSVRKVPVEVYSRVVGYYRPVQQWNKGKQEEFSERTIMKVIYKPEVRCECGGQIVQKSMLIAACVKCGEEFIQG